MMLTSELNPSMSTRGEFLLGITTAEGAAPVEYQVRALVGALAAARAMNESVTGTPALTEIP